MGVAPSGDDLGGAFYLNQRIGGIGLSFLAIYDFVNVKMSNHG